MKETIISILAALGIGTTAFAGFGDVYLSRQVGTSPTNGYVLQTDGTNSTWVATSTLGIVGGGGSGSGDPFVWTPETWGSSTPTVLGFLGGFLSQGSSTVQTLNIGAGQLSLAGLTNALLSTNGSGTVVATTSIGTNLLTGTLVTVNGTALTAGGTQTITAASSTLLANNNTFSGSNIFSQPLTLSGTTGTTTIASGQGFTVGSSQLVVQQGSGNVGVGTTTPSTQKLVVAQTSALDGISAVGNHTMLSGIFFSRNYSATGVSGASGTTQFFTAGSNGAASGWLDSAGVLEAQTQNGLILGAYSTGGIHFQTGIRSTRMTISNAGNVGIGTTTPYAKLSVVGQAVAEYFTATSTAAINTLPLLTSTTATTTNLAISGVTSSLLKTNALGQVTAAVAGTDYANFAYPFPSNATSTNLSLSGGLTFSGTASNIALGSNYLSGDGDDEGVYVNTDGDVGIGTTGGSYRLAITSPNTADTLLLTSTAASGQARLTLTGGASGIGQIDNTVGHFYLTNIATAGDIIMRTSPAGLERFRILSTGNVGIGDSTPDNLLDIASSTAQAALSIFSGGTDTDALIKFELTDNSPLFTVGIDDSDADKFKISGSALGTNDRITIDSSGNVGVGTSTPGSILSVQGVANFVASAVSTIYNGLNVMTTFIMPSSASQSPTTAGQIALDTTSNQIKYGNGSATLVLGNGYLYPSFTYSTSTTWTGTTTIPLGTAFVGETWSGIQCFTDTGTVQVSIYDGTNRMNWLSASTTVGTVTLSTNNTFTAAEKRYVDIGTPASSPTKVSCTVRKAITAD